MKVLILSAALIAALSSEAHAGCIGPVIMGECKGSTVPYDTHLDGQMRQDAPPGFYWDKRGSQDEKDHPDAINPFTGKDAHDSDWSGNQRSGTYED